MLRSNTTINQLSIPALLVVLVLLLATGCSSFLPLARELERLSRSVVLGGIVDTRHDLNDVLVIATSTRKAEQQSPPSQKSETQTLTAELTQREVIAYSRLQSSSAFALMVPDNRRYWVTAFADLNGNGRWDEDEEGGEVGGKKGIWAATGSAFNSLSIALEDQGLLPTDSQGSSLVVPSDAESLEAVRVRSGNISSLDDVALNAETGRTGLWQPMEYAQTVGFGIDFLEPYDPNRCPVLFINGTGGSPQDWRPAIEDIDLDVFQPWVLLYPSGVRLEAVVESTVKALRELEERHSYRQVIVVAHSMGGLVARAVAQKLSHPQSAPHVSLLVTVSTPFDGHAAASQGVKRSPAVIPVWRDLEPGSGYLRRLAGGRLDGRVPHAVLFGFGQPTWLMTGNNDGTVTVASQLPLWLQEDAALVRGFDSNHENILTDSEMLEFLSELFHAHHSEPGESGREGEF